MIIPPLMEHIIAIWLAVFLDLLIGDPRWMPHPVIGMGKLIGVLDKSLNKGRNKRIKGVFLLAIICTTVFSLSFLIVYYSYNINAWLGIAVEALLIFTTISQKSLAEAARAVEQPLAIDDLKESRIKLSWIVGRDTDHLEEPELVRGTVETVAENTSDGITAPLFYSLIGGAPLALVYRAVNTCDSMVGYKNDIYYLFGWASARFDDVLNLIPSRLTGIAMIISNSMFVEQPFHKSWNIMIRDAKKHPSPNSGWCEAATAGLLQIQLGGINQYKGVISERARMGDPTQMLTLLHIGQSIKIMNRTVWLYVIFLTIGGVCIEIARTWS